MGAGPRGGEGFLVSAIFEPMAHELLRCAGLTPGDRLLDLACASAIVARLARRQGARLAAGLDLNRARLHGAPAGSGALLCHADAVRIPFADAAFSLVACQHGLQFFADRHSSLAECHRVLSRGGRLIASSWCSIEQNPGFWSLDRAIRVHAGAGSGPGTLGGAEAASAVPFSLPDAGQVASEFGAVGFENTSCVEHSFDVRFSSSQDFARGFVRSTSLAPFFEDSTALDEVVREVQADLRPYEQAGQLVLPASAYFVLGTKVAG